MAKLFANSGDPDQAPHSVASDQGLHCLQITLLGFPDYDGLKLTNIFVEYQMIKLILLFFSLKTKT